MDRVLRVLQRRGVSRGVFGASSAWTWVAIGAFTLRRFRKMAGSEPVVVHQQRLGPGQALRIDHLAETYGGKRVRARRR
ncbi:MAG: hypothetical protein ACLFXM_06570 [Acidimicrobiia bacterium]